MWLLDADDEAVQLIDFMKDQIKMFRAKKVPGVGSPKKFSVLMHE